MTGGRQGSTSQTGARTLRWVLAVVAITLVVVVAGFIIVARHRAHDWLAGVPKHLGVDIQQETNSFTYSQSSKGKKIFTVHASKEVQRKDGKIALHDVGIMLYDAAGQPSDRIHGTDFEYDQKAQLLTAQGEVYIDLVPPPAKDGSAAKGEDESARVVHVKTIGLLFDQKEQVASSEGAVEFQTGGYTGNAVGARYDGKSGVVVLRSAVRMSGIRNERPVVLTATRAEMDRKESLIDLQAAQYLSTGDSGSTSASAAHAVVHTTTDETPQRVDAEGNVTLTGDRRGTVMSNRMDLALGPKGQARAAHLFGDVRYTNDENGKREQGHAQDARIAFDEMGRPVHALMTGGVTFMEQGTASLRNLDAATLDVSLGGGGKQPTVVKDAEAFGPQGARLKLVDENAKGRNSTDMKADRLVGRFAMVGNASQLTGLDGNGHSWVQRIGLNPAGAQTVKDTSTGDVLHVDFKPGDKGRSEMTRAEQRGNVTTVYEAVQKKGPPQVEHGRADDAVFEAAANVVHLTGSVEVQDETSSLFADRVDANRGTGEATANGSVKVLYLSTPASGVVTQKSEPVHVLAARAVGHKASGLAEFFGDATAKARMWQGGSQVEAPELDFYRTEKRLVAKSDAGSEAAMVRAVLVGTDVAAPAPGAKKQSGPIRIVSREMVYTDSARTVEFHGAVRVVDADGTLTSDEATVWLTGKAAAPVKTADTGAGLMTGKVDHIVATGSVVVEEPGRKGTGEKLVYTASDGVSVLTGTKAVPPKVVDETQGMTTGPALRFIKGSGSVQVLGSDGTKATGRVRSETRARQ